MSGNRRKGIVLQDRDRHLLKELGMMRVIDREQAKVIAGFGSTTRANTRLLALTRAGLLRRTFLGTIAMGLKAIYGLAPNGAALVAAPLAGLPLRQGQNTLVNPHLEHQLQINSVYLAVKYLPISVTGFRFKRWISFREPTSPSIALIPDGYFELESAEGTRAVFVEVDLGSEAPKLWQQKTQGYLQLAISGQFSKLFSQSQFRLAALTTNERHLKNIRSAVCKFTDKIFWFSTFEQINRNGFWSPVWLRPKGDQKHSLL